MFRLMLFIDNVICSTCLTRRQKAKLVFKEDIHKCQTCQKEGRGNFVRFIALNGMYFSFLVFDTRPHGTRHKLLLVGRESVTDGPTDRQPELDGKKKMRKKLSHFKVIFILFFFFTKRFNVRTSERSRGQRVIQYLRNESFIRFGLIITDSNRCVLQSLL